MMTVYLLDGCEKSSIVLTKTKSLD